MHSFVSAAEVAGMTGARTGVARPDITHCITASLRCQASCEAGVARLVSEGLPADSDTVRLLRQCAELWFTSLRSVSIWLSQPQLSSESLWWWRCDSLRLCMDYSFP